MVLVITCMAVLVTPALAKLLFARHSPCHGSMVRLGVLLPNMVPALGKLGEPVSSVTQMWGAGKHARETSLLFPERKPG